MYYNTTYKPKPTIIKFNRLKGLLPKTKRFPQGTFGTYLLDFLWK